MNDTLALIISGFDFMSRPFVNGNGEVQPQKLASPPAPCAMCGEPLMLMEFSKGWELVCDNWRCYMYRRPQGIQLKEGKAEQAATSYHIRHDIGITTRKGKETQRQLELLWRANE